MMIMAIIIIIIIIIIITVTIICHQCILNQPNTFFLSLHGAF